MGYVLYVAVEGLLLSHSRRTRANNFQCTGVIFAEVGISEQRPCLTAGAPSKRTAASLFCWKNVHHSPNTSPHLAGKNISLHIHEYLNFVVRAISKKALKFSLACPLGRNSTAIHPTQLITIVVDFLGTQDLDLKEDKFLSVTFSTLWTFF